jgi:hypothetical protein
MNGYKLLDRTKEISSVLGLVLVAVAVFVGFKLSPDDPFKFVPVLLAALGGLGIAVPDKQAIGSAEDFALRVAKAYAAISQQPPQPATPAAPAQPTAPAAPAGSVAAPVIALLIAAGLMLSACSTVQAPEKTLIASCDTYGTAISRLAAYRAQGRLSDAQIATVDKVRAVAGPICAADAIPDNADSAIAAVDQAAANLLTILPTEKK